MCLVSKPLRKARNWVNLFMGFPLEAGSLLRSLYDVKKRLRRLKVKYFLDGMMGKQYQDQCDSNI